MSEMWDQSRIEQYIAQEIEESLTLDYKAAASLAKSDGKKTEITKDVSAMANSAGGVLIYGISEYQDKVRKHLPEKIDPIDRIQFPKEWLEQVISNIRPKIDGIIIHPIALDTAPNHVAYAIEIPQSSTAHQATDKRYYKRFNFESTAMDDYEIRDVMARNQHPKIELQFVIKIRYMPKIHCELEITAVNVGGIYAKYVNAFIEIPRCLGTPQQSRLTGTDGELIDPRSLDGYVEIERGNLVIDKVTDGDTWTGRLQGVRRYVPLLPKTSQWWGSEFLGEQVADIPLENLVIRWHVHADNAPVNLGEIAVSEIDMIGKTKD